MTKEELLKEMERLFEAGDEKALEAFAIEHFKELPEDVQGKLLLSFYTQTVGASGGDSSVAQVQKEGMDALKKLDVIQTELSKPAE
jgi:hypothetical protein